MTTLKGGCGSAFVGLTKLSHMFFGSGTFGRLTICPRKMDGECFFHGCRGFGVVNPKVAFSKVVMDLFDLPRHSKVGPELHRNFCNNIVSWVNIHQEALTP